MTKKNNMQIKKMNVLVLYSWEGNNVNAKEWACALCLELNRYNSINAHCDMLWTPKSNIKATLQNKIHSADKIVVIITASYNEKIENGTGMVSYEESIYRKVVQDPIDNRIVFILKEHEIELPDDWRNYLWYDFSMINDYDYFTISAEEKKELFAQLVRFCLNIPEYQMPEFNEHLHDPSSHVVKTFDELFEISELKINDETESEKSLSIQERELIDAINKNKNQQGYVLKYIQSGLAADLNLNGKMTLGLFSKYFMVSRNNSDEEKFNYLINGLFKSRHYNMLCIQSDGGSGKTIFIKSLSYRNMGTRRDKTKYRYNNIVIDLTSMNENGATKEEIIFQKFKKLYKRMSKADISKETFSRQWRRNFVKRLDEIQDIEFPANELFTRMYEFEEQLNEVIDIIRPNKNVVDWYCGYSQRLDKARENNKGILFVIVLLLYIMALDTRPSVLKNDRFIIVFDNIETFDNGNTTRWIAKYIQKSHSFIRGIFEELGILDSFFLKFTFVFTMRTSTALPFASMQSDIWNGTRYIRRLEFFDFMPKALLLKLRFLERIPNIKKSFLYQDFLRIILTIIPRRSVERFLSVGEFSNDDMRYFASFRFMPLFNNNYRTAMRYITDIVTDDDIYDSLQDKIAKLEGKDEKIYNYAINGIRMIIFRQIFNDFKINGYLKAFGFATLSGCEQHSITRVILSYLYWAEIQYLQNGTYIAYRGVLLYDLINELSFFYKAKEISEVLYNLSIYSSRDQNKKEALNAWGHLIVFENLNYYLSADDFAMIIEKCSSDKESSVVVGDNRIDTKDIYVMLSSAGMCFEQYYIRSIEFIMSRSSDVKNTPALFLLDNESDIKSALDSVYSIIDNCHNKLITEGISDCILFGHHEGNKQCVFLDRNSRFDIFSCSLFIRYQECLDLIRDSIDYIDRFRVQFNSEKSDNAVNSVLLDYIGKFYLLYNSVKEKMLPKGKHNEINIQYHNMWDFPQNESLNGAFSVINKENVRIGKMRPIQSYYCRNNENILKVIEGLREFPSTETLYSAILSSLGITD